MAFNVPPLQRTVPIVEDDRTPTLGYAKYWDKVTKRFAETFDNLQDQLSQIENIEQLVDDAQQAADSAQAAANDAQDSAAASLLAVSGTIGCTITASDNGASADIVVSSHTRVYGDGSTVAVTGSTIPSLIHSTEYYIYYNDADRAGGAVTFVATTTVTDAIQVNGKHLVGRVTTPASLGSPVNGEVILAPGLNLF